MERLSRWAKGIILGAGIAASSEAAAQEQVASNTTATEQTETPSTTPQPRVARDPFLSSLDDGGFRARMEAGRARAAEAAEAQQERLSQPQERVLTEETSSNYSIITENGERFFETPPAPGQERGQRVALKDHLGNNLRPNETNGYQVEFNGEWVDVAQFTRGRNGELIALPVSPTEEMQYRAIDAGNGIEVRLIDPNAAPEEISFDFSDT